MSVIKSVPPHGRRIGDGGCCDGGDAGAARRTLSPNKPIVIVAPFGPGTTNDIIARLLAQDMTVHAGPKRHRRELPRRHGQHRRPTMSRNRGPTATRW